MKTITLILVFITAAMLGKSQSIESGKVTDDGIYTTYIAKSGDTIEIGDTLTIGKPSGEFGFVYITQGSQRVQSWMAGKKIAIYKMRGYGTKKSGYKLYLLFKGFGIVPVFLDYDSAIETGEVINPKARLTREQAISKLKESKDLLDLQLMTQVQYDSLKKKLAPIIMPNK